MATPKKKPAVVDDVQAVEVPKQASDTIKVVFDGQGNKTVSCCINGVGYTYPADVEVETTQAVADVIGRFRAV